MWMFWAFKLSFGVDILAFLAIFPKIRQNFIQFSGHTGGWIQVLYIGFMSQVSRRCATKLVNKTFSECFQ
jgi:hypothetical protein